MGPDPIWAHLILQALLRLILISNLKGSWYVKVEKLRIAECEELKNQLVHKVNEGDLVNREKKICQL